MRAHVRIGTERGERTRTYDVHQRTTNETNDDEDKMGKEENKMYNKII